LYLKEYNLKSQTIDNVIGPDNPKDCYIDGGENCGEANLDVQIIMGLAQDSPTTYWSVPAPGSSQFEPFLEWIIAVANVSNPPLVHSVSYGDMESDLSPEMMNRFSVEVQKLGLRGVSVIVSSGDDGVGNNPIRNGKQFCGWNPSFPASDPFVTTIGATQGPESGLPEIGCSSKAGGVISSGGGFSKVFTQPKYQKEAVQGFLDQIAGKKSGFNATGRAYPDVSLLGYNYALFLGGKLRAESGTSASAPAFAGMVTLVNGARLAKGKPPLGFLNTALYQNMHIFRDILVGENYCGAGRPPKIVCCDEGFDSTPGWDPVTGLGSVDFAAFEKVFVNL